MASLLDEPLAVFVDDMRVQTGEVTVPGPGLGELEQVRPDPAAARFRMDARLVLEVGEIPLASGSRVRDDSTALVRDPRIGLQTGLVETPPLPQLLAGEADWVALVEVEAVARVQKSRNLVGIVERGRAEGDLVQSGWPDSNRRLLRPKRSTLTRLSYTPPVPQV
jgi:hypothetical protein